MRAGVTAKRFRNHHLSWIPHRRRVEGLAWAWNNIVGINPDVTADKHSLLPIETFSFKQ
jgi:hypothetical protein